MTREEKIKTASAYYINMYGFSYEKCEHLDLYIKGFTDGANWADKHPCIVWHKVTDEPKDKDAELIIDSDVGIRHYTFNYMLYKFGSSETWQTICLHMGIKQWSYADDVITN